MKEDKKITNLHENANKYIKKGQIDKALGIFQEILALKPDDQIAKQQVEILKKPSEIKRATKEKEIESVKSELDVKKAGISPTSAKVSEPVPIFYKVTEKRYNQDKVNEILKKYKDEEMSKVVKKEDNDEDNEDVDDYDKGIENAKEILNKITGGKSPWNGTSSLKGKSPKSHDIDELEEDE